MFNLKLSLASFFECPLVLSELSARKNESHGMANIPFEILNNSTIFERFLLSSRVVNFNLSILSPYSKPFNHGTMLHSFQPFPVLHIVWLDNWLLVTLPFLDFSFSHLLRRFGLLPPEFPTHEELCEHLCGELFVQVLHNRMHVLYQLLPLWKRLLMGYDLVPVTGSSLGLTIDSLLFACYINRLPFNFLFSLTDFVHVLFHTYFV